MYEFMYEIIIKFWQTLIALQIESLVHGSDCYYPLEISGFWTVFLYIFVSTEFLNK